MVPILKKLILILMVKISIFPDQCVFLMPGFREDAKSRMKVNKMRIRVKSVNVS